MNSASRGAQGLIVVALLGVVGLTAWYGRSVWEDSGAFVFVLFGIPLACTALALWAERAIRTRRGSVIVAVLAVVSLVWALLTVAGIGLWFMLPPLLLL